ncbi:MAG: hypothetical protein OFPI_31520 [Osedax symbiont Rs2]|nr:MAG: hypothetical protein OFPI_31520 [Osedax symbiont Rs2]
MILSFNEKDKSQRQSFDFLVILLLFLLLTAFLGAFFRLTMNSSYVFKKLDIIVQFPVAPL